MKEVYLKRLALILGVAVIILLIVIVTGTNKEEREAREFKMESCARLYLYDLRVAEDVALIKETEVDVSEADMKQELYTNLLEEFNDVKNLIQVNCSNDIHEDFYNAIQKLNPAEDKNLTKEKSL